MLGSNILEAAIGLILVYLLFSLVLTAVRESIEAVFKTRATDLERALSELLDDPDGTVRRGFYEHPLISALYRGSYAPKSFTPGAKAKTPTRKLPAYIPARSFALAVIDLVSNAAGQKDVPDAPVSAKVRQTYDLAVRLHGGEPEAVRRELEGWYDSAMDRASGWYRRRTQGLVFVLGLGIAVALNVNSITVARQLFVSEDLRTAVMASAGELTAAPPAAASARLTEAQRDAMEARLKKSGLPIGWDGEAGAAVTAPFESDDAGVLVGGLIELVAGYLMTAFALTLGAPFWFDLLSKMMVVRSTVKPHEKSPEEPSKGRTTPPPPDDGQPATPTPAKVVLQSPAAPPLPRVFG